MPEFDQLKHLPPGLDGEEVRVALAEHALLATWPEGEAFYDAQQPAAFSGSLRKAWHPELEGARIAHIYRQRLTNKSAHAKKASPELRFLAQVDFIITYSWTIWGGLSLWQRLALVDHELTHCGKDEAGWVIVPHDVEEFGTIARRWGDWTPALRTFQRQLELFGGAPAK